MPTYKKSQYPLISPAPTYLGDSSSRFPGLLEKPDFDRWGHYSGHVHKARAPRDSSRGRIFVARLVRWCLRFGNGMEDRGGKFGETFEMGQVVPAPYSAIGTRHTGAFANKTVAQKPHANACQ